jgi:hypothetical protein
LAEKKLIRVTGTGIQITTLGKNTLTKRPRMSLATQQKAATLEEHPFTPLEAKVENLVTRLVKELMKVTKQLSGPYDSGIKPKATAFIYNLFSMELLEPAVAKSLWNLFESRGPSMDFGDAALFVTRPFLNKLGHPTPTGKLLGSAASILLLQKTRQPRLAALVEALLAKEFARDLEALDPNVFKGPKQTPANGFDAALTASRSQAQSLFATVHVQGKAEAVYALIEDMAEDINWHDLGVVHSDWERPANWDSLVSEASAEIHWDLAKAAVLFTAMLLMIPDKRTAAQVRAAALQAFPESYLEDEGF